MTTTPFKRHVYLLGIVLTCCLTSLNGDLSAQTILTIDGIIDQTVANNPQIRVSRQNIEYSLGSYRVARSNFNTSLNLGGSKSRNIYPTALDNPDAFTESESWTYSVGASKLISFGTVISPSFSVYNNNQSSLNNGMAALYIEQPILRGLGTTYNTAQLRIAELNMSSQEHRYFYDASDKLLDALTSYMEVIAAQLNLEVQLETEASMTKTVDQLTRLVDAESIPASELVVSSANLSNQQTNTSLARNRLALSQNLLATSMGISLAQVQAMGSPSVTFPFMLSAIIIDERYTNYWMEESLKLRHDYLAANNDVEASVIGLDFSKKGMLPRLNLNLRAGYNGLYQAENYNQYFNPLFYNIPGMNYNVGLTFDIAPRYDLQKGQRIQAMALNEAVKANLDYQQLQVRKEVRKDCDQLKFYLGATESVNRAVELSRQALENEIKKLEMGISTAFNVALMQNSYLNTLERQIGLLEQLNQTLLQFKHHTGTLLEATGSDTFTINTNQLFVLPQAP